MSPHDRSLSVELFLGSWDRHNRVLLNLLRALPPGGLLARATESSPTVSQMFTHMDRERMISVSEEAPEICPRVPDTEWRFEPDADRIAQLLDESANAVREAVRQRIEAGRGLERNFTHPIYLIQFLIFHESYHHGQIKLALKIAGCPLADDSAGPLIWDVWRARSEPSSARSVTQQMRPDAG
jgi:uncharacterized damage-inducible protein DinB